MSHKTELMNYNGNSFNILIDRGAVWISAKDITNYIQYKGKGSVSDNVEEENKQYVNINGTYHWMLDMAGFYIVYVKSSRDYKAKMKELKKWYDKEVMKKIKEEMYLEIFNCVEKLQKDTNNLLNLLVC